MSCHSLKPNKFLKNLGNETISVNVGVGDSRRAFTVHKAILQQCTAYFESNKLFDTMAGQQGLIFLNEEDPKVFKLFVDWAYNGTVQKPRTKIHVKKTPSYAEIHRLELELLEEFNGTLKTLVSLYSLGERWGIHNLMNRAIDAIQDGYLEYGTVFGPGLAAKIWEETKPDSALREFCIASTVMHLDRGCTKLRQEVMMNCIVLPGYFQGMLKWLSRNFQLLGRRSEEVVEKWTSNESFSMFHRSKLCTCHFHVHPTGQAHKGHKSCEAPFVDCSHPGDDEKMEELNIFNLVLGRARMGCNLSDSE
ncbi:c3967945-c865-41bb-a16d-105ef24135ee [Sclerotinia trifoliorum]|uniref:C3967945-c865-41bb-a16d-105ef24135ee n=1 Tax=Sclerotinia trifoliorum TaxID=28548 RepID=A0A8H2VSU9_9HELO|nr:c3967945-c865-41bb-a16d-105ef24135ee [Sclerotinia trifoliorum]